MANNYVEASFAFYLQNNAQAERALDFLQALEVRLEKDDYALDTYNGFTPEELDEVLKEMDEPEDTGYLGFRCERYDGMKGLGLWIHHDESINPWCAAVFVQWCLKHFDIHSAVTFTWAETCSKPRLDEFGGGAFVITRQDIYSMNTHQWASEKLREVNL